MKNLVFPQDDIPSIGVPFISEKASRAALVRFLNRAKELNVDVHAVEVWHDNELQVSMSMPPYDCTDKRLYYSLSKSFVSTAVGLACDEGLLDPQDHVIDIFPDKLPEKISDNLKKLRLCHVLSMNSGVAVATRSNIFTADDFPKAFLAADFVYEPGTHYLYDSGATAMLAAIVKRVTGLSALDYLDIKLFRYMDIRDVYWDHIADGQIQGGTGFHASCKDAAKLGLLYLNRGVWNGKRLLSEKWIDEASTTHSDNRPSQWPDWESGYCYQFWTCSRGGYRGDGAYGQYCFILPDKGIVVAALCETKILQNAVDIVHEMALELFDDPASEGNVEEIAENFYAMPKTETPVFELPRYFKAEENDFGITFIKLDNIDEKFVFSISNGLSLTSIRCGNGEWIRNRASVEFLTAPNINKVEYQTSERTAGVAAAYTKDGNIINVELRCLYSPHHITMTFTLDDNQLSLSVKSIAEDRLPVKELKAIEVQ